MKLTFPYRLKSEANSREHWTVKHRRHKKERQFLFLALKNLKCQLPVHVYLTRIAPRFLDNDNLLTAFKNIRDSIADILIPKTYVVNFKKTGKKRISSNSRGKSDSDERISWHYFQKKGKPKEYAISIEILDNNNFDMAHTTRQIEEIIHETKKLLDFPKERLQELPKQEQVAWVERASSKLKQLKEILEIPPSNVPIVLNSPHFF